MEECEQAKGMRQNEMELCHHRHYPTHHTLAWPDNHTVWAYSNFLFYLLVLILIPFTLIAYRIFSHKLTNFEMSFCFFPTTCTPPLASLPILDVYFYFCSTTYTPILLMQGSMGEHDNFEHPTFACYPSLLYVLTPYLHTSDRYLPTMLHHLLNTNLWFLVSHPLLTYSFGFFSTLWMPWVATGWEELDRLYTLHP